jgi:RND superfamily putative drug exporter
LAAGILVDAVIIRMAVVPAAMFLLGRSNWWFPNRLDHALPRLGVDPDTVRIGEGELKVPDTEKATA